MVDFSYLDELHVRADRTAKFVFHRIKGAPVFVVAPASGEANPAYAKALMARGTQIGIRAGSKDADIRRQALREARALDVELYPKLVVRDWRVRDRAGNLVPFSADDCREFLSRLPADLFDDLREFCVNLDNFRGDGPSAEDLEALGNS